MQTQKGYLGWMCEEQSNEGWRRAFVFILLLTFFTTSNWEDFSSWSHTQWLFDYEFGLIKRGLFGAFLSSIGMVKSYENLRVLSAALSILLEVMLAFVFTRVAVVDSKMTGGWLFALFWLTHPCTIPHFLYDMGRLDIPSLQICALAVISILYLNHRLTLAVATLASTLLILVHEANALLFVPLVFACWLYPAWDKLRPMDWAMLALSLAWLGGTALHIGSLATVPGFSLDSFAEHLMTQSPPIEIEAIEPLFTGATERRILNADLQPIGEIVTNVFFAVIGLAPSVVLIVQMAKAVYTGVKLRAPDLFLLGAVLSPLLVSALGTDYFRWLSISFTNLAFALVVVARSKATSSKLIDVTFLHKGLLFTCVALHGALGAIAHDSSFNTLWRFSHRIVAALAFETSPVDE